MSADTNGVQQSGHGQCTGRDHLALLRAQQMVRHYKIQSPKKTEAKARRRVMLKINMNRLWEMVGDVTDERVQGVVHVHSGKLRSSRQSLLCPFPSTRLLLCTCGVGPGGLKGGCGYCHRTVTLVIGLPLTFPGRVYCVVDWSTLVAVIHT